MAHRGNESYFPVLILQIAKSLPGKKDTNSVADPVPTDNGPWTRKSLLVEEARWIRLVKFVSFSVAIGLSWLQSYDHVTTIWEACAVLGLRIFNLLALSASPCLSSRKEIRGRTVVADFRSASFDGRSSNMHVQLDGYSWNELMLQGAETVFVYNELTSKMK